MAKDYEFDIPTILWTLLLTIGVILIVFFLLVANSRFNSFMAKRRFKAYLRKQYREYNQTHIIGFFHQESNSITERERPLFHLLKMLQEGGLFQLVLYTSSSMEPKKILQQVYDKLRIQIASNNLQFVHVSKKDQGTTSTRVQKALQSMQIVSEAMQGLPCDIFIDTTGVPFAYPFIKVLYGSSIITYAQDSFQDYHSLVEKQLSKLHKIGRIRRFKKWINDKVTQKSLTFCTYFSNSIIANSKWTRNQLTSDWRQDHQKTMIIYPPLQTQSLINAIPHEFNHPRQNLIVSCFTNIESQDNFLALSVWSKVVKQMPQDALFIVFVARGEEEGQQQAMKLLNDYVSKHQMQNTVKFETNYSRQSYLETLSQAKVGLNTQSNEPYGIYVAEYMLAGMIAIAHKSGGPQEDIIGSINENVGFLASSEEEFVDFVLLSMTSFNKFKSLRDDAREYIESKFQQDRFNKQWQDDLCKLL